MRKIKICFEIIYIQNFFFWFLFSIIAIFTDSQMVTHLFWTLKMGGFPAKSPYHPAKKSS